MGSYFIIDFDQSKCSPTKRGRLPRYRNQKLGFISSSIYTSYGGDLMNWVSQIDVKNLCAKLQLRLFFFYYNPLKRYVTTFLNASMISDSFCISLYPFTKQWISTYKKVRPHLLRIILTNPISFDIFFSIIPNSSVLLADLSSGLFFQRGGEVAQILEVDMLLIDSKVFYF